MLQRGDFEPGSPPLPAQRRQRSTRSTCDLAFAAEDGVLEVDLDIDAAVGAALGLTGAATGGCAAEERLEDVTEAAEVGTVEAASEVEALQSGVAEAVVRRALLGVRQDLVGLADFLEARFGAVVFVAVRVVLHRQPAERLLQVFWRGVAGDAQYLVVVFSDSRHVQIIVSGGAWSGRG